MLEGNAGKRPLNRREPQPAPGIPAMPAWLPVRARPFWPRLIEQLAPMHVLTNADVFALAQLADALAEWQDAAKGKGKPKVASDAMRRAFTLYNRFGLTPADRTRLVAQPKADADPLDELRERREQRARKTKPGPGG